MAVQKNIKMKLWFDVMNTPHAHFLNCVNNNLNKGYETFFTSRNYAETAKVLENYGIDFISYGKHGGSSYFGKRSAAFRSIFFLLRKLPNFDINISMMSHISPIITRLKGRKSIGITDNELFIGQNKRLIRLFNDIILPIHLKDSVTINGTTNFHFFNGLKEDVYISNYNFQNIDDKIPFDNFVTLRPEALMAPYVKNNRVSLVEELIASLSKKGINILFLPRYDSDKLFAKKFKNVFVPSETLNGIDICNKTDAVITGSGTLAREATRIGTPAVSFYPDKLLKVDQYLVNSGKIFHSRNVSEIVDFVLDKGGKRVKSTDSSGAKSDFFKILKKVISDK